MLRAFPARLSFGFGKGTAGNIGADRSANRPLISDETKKPPAFERMAFLFDLKHEAKLACGGDRCGGRFADSLALLNLAGTKATGANQHALRAAINDGADGLQIRHLPAQMDAGDVQPDSTGLFGFTPTGDLARLDGAF